MANAWVFVTAITPSGSASGNVQCVLVTQGQSLDFTVEDISLGALALGINDAIRNGAIARAEEAELDPIGGVGDKMTTFADAKGI